MEVFYRLSYKPKQKNQKFCPSYRYKLHPKLYEKQSLCFSQKPEWLLQISDAVIEANAIPLIMQIRIPPNYGKRYVAAFESIYSQIAEEKNLVMLSFLLEKVALDENLMQRDGIHPNSKAQPIIANQVQEELLRIIK